MNGDPHGLAPGPDAAGVARQLRRLTRAVWVLAVLLGLVLAVLGTAGWVVVRTFSGAQVMAPDVGVLGGADSAPARASEPYRYNGFDEWPSERKVSEASAIIVTTVKGSGKDARDVITEVIKQAPGVEFHYKVGDTYDMGWGSRVQNEADMPELGSRGQIVFFVGSPASMNYAVSYEPDTGRCSSMGGISLDQLRELARQTPDVQRKG